MKKTYKNTLLFFVFLVTLTTCHLQNRCFISHVEIPKKEVNRHVLSFLGLNLIHVRQYTELNNSKGKKIEWYAHDNLNKVYYSYDSLGRIKKEWSLLLESNHINHQMEYTYLPNKKIEVGTYFKHRTTEPSNTTSIIETYFSDGRLETRSYLYGQVKKEDNWETHITYLYDEKNKLKEKISFSKDHFSGKKNVDTIKYFYDNNFLAYELIKEEQSHKRIRYERDAQGRALEMVEEYRDNKSGTYGRAFRSEHYQYNNKGYLYSKTTKDGVGETTIYYYYDDYGRIYKSYWNVLYFFVFNFCECNDYY